MKQNKLNSSSKAKEQRITHQAVAKKLNLTWKTKMKHCKAKQRKNNLIFHKIWNESLQTKEFIRKNHNEILQTKRSKLN